MTAAEREQQQVTRRWFTGRAKWLTFIAITLAAFYLLAVTPLRTYFQQQHQMHQAEQRYAILADTNKQLQDRVTQLQSDDDIKKLAREKYELVEPGQQAYAVMPPSPAITQPAQEQAQALQRQETKKKALPQRIWDAVNPWN